MKTYKADSLDAIAAQFEHLAKGCATRRAGAKTHREGHILLAEARTWRQAASMLRDTEMEPAK